MKKKKKYPSYKELAQIRLDRNKEEEKAKIRADMEKLAENCIKYIDSTLNIQDVLNSMGYYRFFRTYFEREI